MHWRCLIAIFLSEINIYPVLPPSPHPFTWHCMTEIRIMHIFMSLAINFSFYLRYLCYFLPFFGLALRYWSCGLRSGNWTLDWIGCLFSDFSLAIGAIYRKRRMRGAVALYSFPSSWDGTKKTESGAVLCLARRFC